MAEHLIDGSEKRICRLSFLNVRVRMLLKGAVTQFYMRRVSVCDEVDENCSVFSYDAI